MFRAVLSMSLSESRDGEAYDYKSQFKSERADKKADGRSGSVGRAELAAG
jgi:hypothetical protein